MATDQASTGYGSILSKGDGNSPENFIAVLGLKSISGPSISRDIHDTTEMTGNGWRTKIGGLVDAGEIQGEFNWLPRDPSQSQEEGGLMAEFDKTSCGSLSHWRLSLPECPGQPAAYWEFDGIFSGQDATIPMDDLMSFQGTVTISGRPTLVIEES